MVVILTKPPQLFLEPELADVVADLTQVYECIGTVSAAEKVYSASGDSIETAYQKMPDIVHRIFGAHYGASKELAAGDTHKVTITENGKITNEDTWDNNTGVYYWLTEICHDVTSLRQIFISSDIPEAVARSDPAIGKVEVLTSNDGATYTKVAEYFTNTGKSVDIIRKVFQEYNYVKVRVCIHHFTALTASQIGYLSFHGPVSITWDFRNQYETDIYSFMLAGAIAIGVGTLSDALIRQYVGMAPGKFTTLAAELGVTLVEMFTIYLVVWNKLVTDGILSWSDFNLEDMFLALVSVKGMLALGIAGALGVLKTYFPDNEALKIINIIGQGTKGVLLASAYLQYLAKVTRYIYP